MLTRHATTGSDSIPPRPAPGHLGQHTMRDRAHAAGGTLRSVQRPGQGTVVRAGSPPYVIRPRTLTATAPRTDRSDPADSPRPRAAESQARDIRPTVTERGDTMSTTQWILNLGLLGWVLLRNLGSKPVTRATFAVPLLDRRRRCRVFLTRHPDRRQRRAARRPLRGRGRRWCSAWPRPGRPAFVATGSGTVITAGAAFAASWIAVIGGRIAFAQWATGAGCRTVGEFSSSTTSPAPTPGPPRSS